MKKAILHGLQIPEDFKSYVDLIIERLRKNGIEYAVTQDFLNRNSSFLKHSPLVESPLNSNDGDIVFSLGGDGTFLESVVFVGPAEIPILGVNMGRLGFLASIAKEYVDDSLSLLLDDQFDIDDRSMVQVESSGNLFETNNFGLNECAVLRKDSSAMIMVKCYINETFLNNYWADGVMVSTPTGSTGYSLSCGGPLMMPDAKDFVITPVSPHNLNVRPLIVSDSSVIRFEIETRDRSFLVSLDSRYESIEEDIHLIIKKSQFSARTVRLNGINFPDTIRNKLGWGFDKRN